MWEVDWRSKDWILTQGLRCVTKEKLFLEASKWSLERRMGWETWSLERAASKSGISGGLERRRDKTVMPVPLGTALHQLYSVPPTVLILGSGVFDFGFWSDLDMVGEEKLRIY